MRWEYIRVQVSTMSIAETDGKLTELGRDGWELTCAVEASGSYVHLWFKRPLGGWSQASGERERR